MIDNFSELNSWMKFNPGTYYKFVALVRAKDFKDGTKQVLNTNERGEIFVRQWFVDSEESLKKYKPDMINLCDATKARLYVTTDSKSVKKTVLEMRNQLDKMITSWVYSPNSQVSIRKLSKFSASASQLDVCSQGTKYWLIDVDYDKMESKKDCIYLIHCLTSLIGGLFYNMRTHNGWHLLFERNFDIHDRLDKILNGVNPLPIPDEETYKCMLRCVKENTDSWSVKENALTLVYFNKEGNYGR